MKPVYNALQGDSAFDVSVIAVPYRHVTSGNTDFNDGGATLFLRNEGVAPIEGYNRETKEWLDLRELAPDFVFFQTPYDSFFPYSFTSDYVSLFARICYVPYVGFHLYKGEVDEITHPRKFFQNISIAFVPHRTEQQELTAKFPHHLTPNRVVVAGSPMTDYTLSRVTPKGTGWKRGIKAGVKRVLWTPRWRTTEQNCHFFDYKDYLLNLADKRDDIDFLFRPHPLCLQNFVTTGEMTQKQQDELMDRIARMSNAGIDRSGDYQDTFLSSDILVSDMSSMLGEYFMTGKPIVYTHRVNCFNEFGAKLAEGFYWVRSQRELDEVLSMLLGGEDPLKGKRLSLIKQMFFVPNGGASELIKNFLLSNCREPNHKRPQSDLKINEK